MKIREQRVIDGIHQFCIGIDINTVARNGSQILAGSIGHEVPETEAIWHLRDRRIMVEIHHRTHQIVVTHRIQEWAMRRTRRNHSRTIFPNIHLAIHIANAAHHLRVRGIHVVGLAKRFLRNLPVTRHDFSHMALLV